MGFITCSDWIHAGDWTTSDASDWPSRDSLYSATWSHGLYLKLKMSHPLKSTKESKIKHQPSACPESRTDDDDFRNWLTFSGYEHFKCARVPTPYSFKYCHSILHCHHPHQVNKLLLNYEPPPSYHSTPSTTHHPAIKSPGTLSRLNHLDSI